MRPRAGAPAGGLRHRAPLPACLATRGDQPDAPQYDLDPRHAGAAPALVTLAELVSARRDGLTLAHVKGHAGHTLNEGADLLATIARRWVAATETLPQKAMQTEAADIAATFLAQWHRENPQPLPPRP
jgi:hypothetical protein